ncbi:MAG: prephenate dehydrogenase [Emergencia sp.]|nr:prephenate dehydrogenase [Emergencia sp.]
MKVGIVGLGLIGGSLAKAYKRAQAEVLGFDKDRLTTGFAKLAEAIDDELTEERLSECDLILLAIPPVPAAKWLSENGEKLSKETVVIDCCGTKRNICKAGFALAEKYGFTYAGGHPMAGIQFGGFKNSRADLFDGAVFALVPADYNDLRFMEKAKKLILPAGFSKLVISSAEEHDRVIAFTSQMAHVVSNAFIKSETARTMGTAISAGSYRDFTRVAYLDAEMWTELFMENRDNLKYELEVLIEALSGYAKALEENDSEEMLRLLKEGRERKIEVEQRCS